MPPTAADRDAAVEYASSSPSVRTLDVERRRLLRDAEPLALTDRHYDLLQLLVSRHGQILSKEFLVETAWKGVAVTDNSLSKAIISLRKTLASEGVTSWIEAVPRRGYRFTGEVTQAAARATDESLDRLLAPHRAWLDGRAALESLAVEEIPRALAVFETMVGSAPNDASAHIGLANACVMQFESTRTVMPDLKTLARACDHAREACRLAPNHAEAWATLGFVLGRPGGNDQADAVAASRRATVLEPGNWRHHVRLAATAWGDERLSAAYRAAALLPGCPLAHWLAATVHVARYALADAEHELKTALHFQAGRSDGRSPLSSIALNWLLGLVHFAQGDAGAAILAFERELALEQSGHLYARECAANAHYAIGAVRLFQQCCDEASAAFRAALERIPLHPLALVGLDLLGQSPVPEPLEVLSGAAATLGFRRPFVLDLACAASLARRGRQSDAVSLLERVLVTATPPSEGWTIPVEPLLLVRSDAEMWRPVLARLQMRAV